MRNSLLVECLNTNNDRESAVRRSSGFSLMKVRLSGRRALCSRSKGYGQRALDETQVIMPERVTINRVRIPVAESLRFPGEGKSAQG